MKNLLEKQYEFAPLGAHPDANGSTVKNDYFRASDMTETDDAAILNV
jgi:hypothetical protein